MNVPEERSFGVVLHIGAEEDVQVFGDSPRQRMEQGRPRPCCACRGHRERQSPAGHAMISTPASTPVEAWLQWFATQKQTPCRAYLCTRYHLDTLDAAVLINAALLQVFLHWDTIENPLGCVDEFIISR
jgi:hypothetical protein